MDYILKEELGPFYIGIPSLYKVFFKEVKGLKEASTIIFKKCKKGIIHYMLKVANITSLKAQSKIIS